MDRDELFATGEPAVRDTLMLPDLVLRRRLHETNQGIRERGAAVDYVRILKASLDRRRAAEKTRKANDESCRSRAP